jgi:hypothetical protein
VSALDPPAVVTTTSTAPAATAGVIAVIDVSESTPNAVAALPPKVTDETLVKPLPVIVTAVPPSALPDVGEITVTTGAS